MTAYRYPYESLILWLTIGLVLAIIAFTAAATVCLSVVFVIAVLLLSFFASQRHHRVLIERAMPVTPSTLPGLAHIIAQARQRLRVEPVNAFIVPSRTLNAYTFGLSSPKALVLYDALLKVMDRDELQFVIGHELGHVALGHTWLNSLVGGMAGIPAPYSASYLLILALRWWNRACEFSADRAGLLACGKPSKALSALVKLEAGAAGASPEAFQRALQRIEAQDDDLLSNLGELLATHPLIVKRMEQLKQYAQSPDYRRLIAQLQDN